jgi:hypothetical protein
MLNWTNVNIIISLFISLLSRSSIWVKVKGVEEEVRGTSLTITDVCIDVEEVEDCLDLLSGC